MRGVAEIVRAMTKWNNVYRSAEASVENKLDALWQIGNYLHRIGVQNPHALGWRIQAETNGLVKRPTIFRSYKLRAIWQRKEDLLKDCRGMKGLSNLREMLPLLDPAQEVHKKIPDAVLSELKKQMRTLAPGEFSRELAAVKARFKGGRLGERLDRSKHLRAYAELCECFEAVMASFEAAVNTATRKERDRVRSKVSEAELRALSNMAIGLTSRENVRFYKRLEPQESSSAWREFATLYRGMRVLLDEQSEVERARLRRLINPVELALFSDLASSLVNEKGVVDFMERRTLGFPLK